MKPTSGLEVQVTRTQRWANELTAKFWRRLNKDIPSQRYWRKIADQQYRRNLTDEPMPGIWPKFNARGEIAMAIFESLEHRSSKVPNGFLEDLGDSDIEDVDCYSLAEGLLDERSIAAIDATSPKRRRIYAR
jgi:hypothetical protein